MNPSSTSAWFGLFLLAAGPPLAGGAKPYDYKAHPVQASDPEAVQAVPMVVDGVGGGSTMPFAPYTYLNKPGISHCERKGHLDWGGAGWTDAWTPDCSEPEAPTPERPARLKLDYGKPVAAAKFAFYFPRQGNQDGYLPETAHAAAVRALELFRSADGTNWDPVLRADPLPWTCPQVVEIPEPKPARYYLFSFEAMMPGNTALRLYEIETYLDPAAEISTEPLTPPAPPPPPEPQFAPLASGRLAAAGWNADWSADAEGVKLRLEAGEARFDTALRLLPDAQAPEEPWRAAAGAEGLLAAPARGGWAFCRLAAEPAGLRLRVQMPAPREGERRRFIYLRIPVPGGRIRFMPAYLWSEARPRGCAWPGWWLPTCMAAIQTDHGSLALAPSQDRCRIGIDGDELTLCLFPEAGEAGALLLPVPGGWWEAYQRVVREVDRFSPRRQFRPTGQAALDRLRWLMSDAAWSEPWGNLRSFPAAPGQPPEEAFFFIFYGAPYGIPALWQRFQIAGDELAGERVRRAARFLLEAPARVKEGPMKGGYYSQMGGARRLFARSDQAGNVWMTSHATGAALWALLFYRRLLLDLPETELDPAIAESADLLCRLQRPDGGWHYAHLEDGSIPSGAYLDAGTIWNVWALQRAGKALDQPRYLEAARRGKDWWVERFLDRHAYTGYWEDSHSRGVIYPTREGYEGALAVLAFLEMGDLERAVDAARDLATWVHTRTPSYRDYDTGYGNISEQWTWPANVYLAPQAAVALQRIFEATGDEFWKPYTAIAKGIGWWMDEETGAGFFPNEASGYIPFARGPLYKNYWVDWNCAQEASRALWWLIGAINGSSAGAIRIDPDRLDGTVEGAPAQAWLPDGAVRVDAGKDNQLNWMGYKTASRFYLAVLNDLDQAAPAVRVNAGRSLGVAAAPKARIVQGGAAAQSLELHGEKGGWSFSLPPSSLALLEWPLDIQKERIQRR